MERIPVYILTGYLGSGKTTFLNHLMKSHEDERFLIIENEIGAVNIDEKLVVGNDLDLVALSAGCLCCSLNDELLDVLEEVSARRESFDSLVIETTGIADPSTVAAPFFELESVRKVFELKAVACLVDLKNIENWMAETNEAGRQIAAADFLLLNKADTVTTAELEDVQKKLININPSALIQKGEHGVFDTAALLSFQTETEEYYSERIKKIEEQENKTPHGIQTFSLKYNKIDLRSLIKDMMLFLQVNQQNVFRIKAIIAVPDYPRRIVLQSVRSSYSLTDGPLWENEEDRNSHFVFIGRSMNKASVKTMIESHCI